MAEDSAYATRSGGGLRGTRYPGFTSTGAIDTATGVGLAAPGLNASPTGVAGGGGQSSNSLSSQSFDVPTIEQPSLAGMAKGLGGMAASGATQWAATEVGKGAGSVIAQGASLGEGVKAGVEGLGNTVSGWFGSAATEAANQGAQAATTLGAQKVYETASQVGPMLSEAPAFTQTTNSATSGSALGGAAGAGISRAVVGVATGEKPAAALRAGVGAGAGYYGGLVLGTAIGGPVGGAVGSFIGSTIGSIFCFAAGTPIMMADGTWRPVETLDIGDAVALGGKVVGCGKVQAEDLRRYKGVTVEAGHAVFEDGRWLRVGQSEHADPFSVPEGMLVYPVATENLLLVTPSFIAADVNEVNDPAAQTDDQRLQSLNSDAMRNGILTAFSWFPSEGPTRALPVAMAGGTIRFVDGGTSQAAFPMIPLGDLLSFLGADAGRYAPIAQLLTAIGETSRAEVDGEQVSLIPCSVVLEAVCEAAAAGIVGEEVVRQFDAGAVQACHCIALRLGMPFGTFMAEAGRAERARLQSAVGFVA